MGPLGIVSEGSPIEEDLSNGPPASQGIRIITLALDDDLLDIFKAGKVRERIRIAKDLGSRDLAP